MTWLQPVLAAEVRIASSASMGIPALYTAGAPFLKIPDFVVAILAWVSPRNSVWSSPMEVTMATSGPFRRTFVASSLPPMPTSTTATSTPALTVKGEERGIKDEVKCLQVVSIACCMLHVACCLLPVACCCGELTELDPHGRRGGLKRAQLSSCTVCPPDRLRHSRHALLPACEIAAAIDGHALGPVLDVR